MLNRPLLKIYQSPSDNILYHSLKMTRSYFNYVLNGGRVYDNATIANFNRYTKLMSKIKP